MGHPDMEVYEILGKLQEVYFGKDVKAEGTKLGLAGTRTLARG